MSALPGLRFPSSAPLFLPKDEFLEYLHRYRSKFELPIVTDRNVGAVTREDGAWRIASSGGQVTARALVVATGIMSNPRVPELEGISDFRGTGSAQRHLSPAGPVPR